MYVPFGTERSVRVLFCVARSRRERSHPPAAQVTLLTNRSALIARGLSVLYPRAATVPGDVLRAEGGTAPVGPPHTDGRKIDSARQEIDSRSTRSAAIDPGVHGADVGPAETRDHIGLETQSDGPWVRRQTRVKLKKIAVSRRSRLGGLTQFRLGSRQPPGQTVEAKRD